MNLPNAEQSNKRQRSVVIGVLLVLLSTCLIFGAARLNRRAASSTLVPHIPTTPPTDPNATALAAADTLFAHQKFSAAQAAYLHILAHDRNSAPAWQGAGLALDAQDKVENAFFFLEHAARLDPTLAPAQTKLAEYYDRGGFPAEARLRLEAALKTEPTNAENWDNLGRICSDNTLTYVEAAEALRHAVALAPNVPEYRVSLAQSQDNLHQDAQAEANLRQALTWGPNNPDTLAALGSFVLSHTPTPAREQEAKRLLQKSVALDKKNTFAWYELGTIALAHGDNGGAVTAFKAVVARTPDNADAWYKLSRACVRTGEMAHAHEALAMSDQLRTDYARRTHAEELVRLHPKDVPLHLALARMDVGYGDNAKAINQFQLVLRLDPQNVSARRELDALTARLKADGHLPNMPLFNAMVIALTRRS